ncbi:MAG: S-methyl-5'-thioinosine phosphorylase [Actinomycetota bacterium]
MYGLITGSGFYQLPGLADEATTDHGTPYGTVQLTTGRWRGHDVVFLPRHGRGHSIPPHAINYRANVWALADAGASAIVATAVSGGIGEAMTPGALVLISDFLDFTSGRETTFFDGASEPGFGAGGAADPESIGVSHTDMTTPYDPTMREALRHAAAAEDIDVVDGGVYCTTNGPRFETAAEITMMARLGGDLVGMTGYPEVALAAEAGVPYASVGVISNRAAGLAAADLSIDEIMAVIDGASDHLYRLIGGALDHHSRTTTGQR